MKKTQKFNFINILKFTLKSKQFVIMLKKLLARILNDDGSISKNNNYQWLKSNCSDLEKFAKNLNEPLWAETLLVSNKINKIGIKKLSSIDYDLGGGGYYPLLYFFARLLKPEVIVETGVAAGFSSLAFLMAIEKNCGGYLYSSDFPYFRLPNPEKYIGYIVDEKYKKNWNLFIEGDKNNLPIIIENIESIDIFHYDSDKTFDGRDYALSLIEKLLNKKSLIIMDDIQDNSFFHDYILDNQIEDWNIFYFEGKYIGLIGSII